MTYLKSLPNLTVKEQSAKITGLITEFFLSNGWADYGSDNGKDIIFHKDGDDIYFKKGYFGANSEPNVYGGWYNDEHGNPDASDGAIEMEKQVDVYIDELRKAILN